MLKTVIEQLPPPSPFSQEDEMRGEKGLKRVINRGKMQRTIAQNGKSQSPSRPARLKGEKNEVEGNSSCGATRLDDASRFATRAIMPIP